MAHTPLVDAGYGRAAFEGIISRKPAVRNRKDGWFWGIFADFFPNLRKIATKCKNLSL